MKAITGDRLKVAVETQTFIKAGDANCAEGVKYDFRLGTRILKASFGQPVDLKNMPEAERSSVGVEPGEIVFVLTEERLDLPQNMIAELSPKRKLSHDGILTLGGFCIDPLYRGRLLFGLYNFSSTRFPLRPGKKLVAAIFFELQEGEVGKFRVPEVAIEDFPDELVRLIQNYKPIALKGLEDALLETQRQFAELKNEIVSARDWQRQFQASLDRHDQQIERLIRGLEDEREIRKETDQSFRQELASIQKQMWKMAAYLTAIVAGIGIVVSTLAQTYIPVLIKALSR
jgi:dCTP deaminase